MLSSGSFACLHLNADFMPLSVAPLSTLSWQDAVRAVISGSGTVVAEYDRTVRSPNFEIRLPSVIATKTYVNPNLPAAFTRQNVFQRDRFTCQYCGTKHRPEDLTFDHVIPRSKGGKTTFLNIVSACVPCNLHKSDKMLGRCGLKLISEPFAPTKADLNRRALEWPLKIQHETWRDVLYWTSTLEP